MKRILVSALLCTSLFAAAQAQTTHTVKLVDTQLQDVLNVLEDMDIYIHRFDVSQFPDATYHVEIYVEEYKNNQKTGKVHHFDLGKNIRSLDEIPEEHRKGFRKEYQIPAGKKEWNNIKEISIYIRKEERTDTTAAIRISVPMWASKVSRSRYTRPTERSSSATTRGLLPHVRYKQPMK